jgi:hypothetical protein
LLLADPLARAEQADLERIVATFERRQFGAVEPSPDEVRAALEAAERLDERSRSRLT